MDNIDITKIVLLFSNNWTSVRLIFLKIAVLGLLDENNPFKFR